MLLVFFAATQVAVTSDKRLPHRMLRRSKGKAANPTAAARTKSADTSAAAEVRQKVEEYCQLAQVSLKYPFCSGAHLSASLWPLAPDLTLVSVSHTQTSAGTRNASAHRFGQAGREALSLL